MVTIAGSPVIDDGHQFRVERPVVIGPCPGTTHRLLLVEDAAVVIEPGHRRRSPPVLLLLPPGWAGSVRLARGAFCYRLDVDGGKALVQTLGLHGLLALDGEEVRPWRSDVVALAQRWWRSFAERRRVAIQCAALLVRLCGSGTKPSAPLGLAGRFQELAREHLGSNERIPALAARLGVSRITLDRAMRSAVGMTASAWWRGERMREAAVLVGRMDRSVGAVAAAIGFRDADSFARAFRRSHGGSPRAWRRSGGIG